jgi:hypothetical protein
MFLSFRQCSICKEMLEPSACTISEIDRDLVFIESNIFIQKDSRCREEHIFQDYLLDNRPETTCSHILIFAIL